MDQIEALQRRVATVEEENGQLRQRCEYLNDFIIRVDNAVCNRLAELGSGGAGGRSRYGAEGSAQEALDAKLEDSGSE